jgi:hypothetical protein
MTNEQLIDLLHNHYSNYSRQDFIDLINNLHPCTLQAVKDVNSNPNDLDTFKIITIIDNCIKNYLFNNKINSIIEE